MDDDLARGGNACQKVVGIVIALGLHREMLQAKRHEGRPKWHRGSWREKEWKLRRVSVVCALPIPKLAWHGQKFQPQSNDSVLLERTELIVNGGFHSFLKMNAVPSRGMVQNDGGTLGLYLYCGNSLFVSLQSVLYYCTVE